MADENNPDNNRANTTASFLKGRFEHEENQVKRKPGRPKASPNKQKELKVIVTDEAKNVEVSPKMELPVEAPSFSITDDELFIEGMKLIASGRQAKVPRDLENCVDAAWTFVEIIRRELNAHTS